MGFKIEEVLFESNSTIVSRAIAIDKTPVILKTLGKGISPLQGHQKLHKEYEISLKLAKKSEYFLMPIEFVERHGRFGITWKDMNLITLKEYVSGRTLLPVDFIDVAKQIVEALHIVHCSGIIHRDITSSNILIDAITKKVYLIDFGSATYWREAEANALPARLGYPTCGTYQYMSPEHTGKVDRAMDYRSDLYSLGIVFYELLSGHTPLSGITSRLAILFAHVTIDFPPLHQLCTCSKIVPLVLSNIITKMLKKELNQRYQSSIGLLYDIQQSEKYLDILSNSDSVVVPLSQKFKSDATIQDENSEMKELKMIQSTQNVRKQQVKPSNLNYPFPLGSRDKSSLLLTPQTIFGREKEITKIVDIFTNAFFSNSPNCSVIIRGYSGSGKTSLIDETIAVLDKIPRFESRHVIKIAFPKFSNIPFQGMGGLFRQIIEYIEEDFDGDLYKLMKQELGSDSIGVLAETLLPKIRDNYAEEIETPPTLTNIESLIRMREVTHDFLHFIFKIMKKRCIIIVLDDLQWADSNSMSLLEGILNLNTLPLFSFIAVRQGELADKDHISQFINSFVTKDPKKVITVRSLELVYIKEIIKEMTSDEFPQLNDLSEIVAKKTKGNPFFVTQFVTKLYTDELLVFNFDKQIWEAKLKPIKETAYTTNVVQLLVSEINTMNGEVKEILEAASCIGIQFKLDLLCKISEKSKDHVIRAISEALQIGFVQPKYTITSKFDFEKNAEATSTQSSASQSVSTDTYVFLHNRVHETFYTSIDEDSRTKLHYQIGNILKNEISKDTKDSELFAVAHHLNLALEDASNTELLELVDLNLRVASLAKLRISYKQALEFTLVAKEILLKLFGDCNSCWEKEYSRYMKVYLLLCDIRSTWQDNILEKNFIEVYQHVTKPIDRIQFYRIQLRYLSNSHKHNEVEQLLLNIMKEFGYNISPDVTMNDFLTSLDNLLNHINYSLVDKLSSLQPSTDKLASDFCEVIITGCPSVYYNRKLPLYSILLLTCIKIQ